MAFIVVTTLAISALRTEAAAGGAHCGHGVKACNANQVGQPCNANNPNVVCSAQASGAYCCLAVGP